MAELLRVGPNRRYGTGLQDVSATMLQREPVNAPLRWNVYAGSHGRLGLAVPRSLVLRLLQRRYGVQDADPGAPEPSQVDAPVTASEERQAHKLGLQMVQALARRIEEGMPPPGAAPAPVEPSVGVLALQGEATQPVGLWLLELLVSEASQSDGHRVCFCLDDGWMRRLLDQLGHGRVLPRDAAMGRSQPLAQRLRLRLVARLVQQRLPLGAILDLQPGNVLPIPQPATVVLVKDSALFSASVAEHKGRLWLTAFQDL